VVDDLDIVRAVPFPF